MTKSVKEIEHVMNVGNQNRAVGSVYIVSFWSNSVILAVFKNAAYIYNSYVCFKNNNIKDFYSELNISSVQSL